MMGSKLVVEPAALRRDSMQALQRPRGSRITTFVGVSEREWRAIRVVRSAADMHTAIPPRDEEARQIARRFRVGLRWPNMMEF
ncbi:MAG: hypothetical protein BGP22_07635 [Variovorax sp. 67-131]|nr:MAG: hypothetical protein ABS94_22280 [Variovorax sp. SCN 67-85]ODV17411.1 MAG: hypothetical protein ABT25_29715 [Variovorax sp. SCN 67-20]OJZ06353.1 MAG: hypothetical protein BGP22_07635 [Variovorax sp. 67-131]